MCIRDRDRPVSPFGAAQWELQIATSDKAVADDLKANHMNVKERDGKFVVALKRKAVKADGSPMDPVRVVDANKHLSWIVVQSVMVLVVM